MDATDDEAGAAYGDDATDAEDPSADDRPFDADDDGYVVAGPGLPAFVHRISAAGWLFVGLAVLVAVERLATSHLLDGDHPWVPEDGMTLISTASRVLLVLAPAFLLHRRPTAWSEDRRLAVAAIVVAAGPILAAISDAVQWHLVPWLLTDRVIDDGFDPGAIRLVFPLAAWLLALATPVLLVRGFDQLDARPPVRFPRTHVVSALAAVILVLLAGVAAAVVSSELAIAAIEGETRDSSLSIGSVALGVAPSLLEAALWTWAALAALAAARAGRGAWWSFLLASAILGQLTSPVLLTIASVIASLAAGEVGWPASASVAWLLAGLGIAVGNAILAGAFAAVPRAAVDSPASDAQDGPGRIASPDAPQGPRES